MKGFNINKHEIGGRHSTYIIAELSANHHQSFENAIDLVKAAYKSGANAVKLQTYTPATLTIDLEGPMFTHNGESPWRGKNLYSLYKEAYTPWEWQPDLKRIANELGMDLFSTPFDFSSVDFLQQMDIPAYKVASFEIVDIPLIRKIAHIGKPVILSTGMASLAEIEDAVHAIRKERNNQLALLKCTSAYPALPEEMNLRTIPHLAQMFNVPVGLSDHTLGISVPVAAVALGACIVEKHFTLSRKIPGPDSAFSLEPPEFKMMVDAIRETEKALGRVCYEVSECENESRVFRRSLFVVKDMKKGELFTDENVRSIRPGYGLAPKYISRIVGKRAKQNLKKGTAMDWDFVQ